MIINFALGVVACAALATYKPAMFEALRAKIIAVAANAYQRLFDTSKTD